MSNGETIKHEAYGTNNETTYIAPYITNFFKKKRECLES